MIRITFSRSHVDYRGAWMKREEIGPYLIIGRHAAEGKREHQKRGLDVHGSEDAA
jgi:hypothetical protein